MRLDRTRHLILVLAAACVLVSRSQAFALSSPTAAHEELDRLEEKARGMAVYKDKNPLGILATLSAKQFELAEQSYREGEFIATVRLLNAVLSQMHELKQDQYLKAHYMLGRSYEELAYPSRAVKAYMRYLSSYASQAGGSDETLIEVMRRILILDENTTIVQKDTLQRLMASLMSLRLEPDLKAQVSMLSSIAAYHAGRNKLASDWFATLHAPETPKQTRVESLFYEALNLLAMGKDDEGEKLLLETVSFQEPSFLFVRDLASLNLARLYSARKMPQNAWEWYRKVDGPGPALRYAAYEGVILLLQSAEYEKALQLARTYMSQYPNTPEAYSLKEKLSFLQLQAGDLDPAEGGLRSREEALVELQAQILANFRRKDRLNGGQVSELKAKTEVFALSSPLLDQSDQLFKRLEKLSFALSEQRQELNSSIFTLGRVSDSSLRPEVLSSNRQYRQLTHQLFTIGDQLLAFEQNLYGKQLTPAQKEKIKRSELRRQRLAGIEQEFQRSNWRTWDELSRMHLRLDALQDKVANQKAQLQAFRLYGSQSTSSQSLRDYGSRADDLLNKLREQEARLAQKSQDLRMGMISILRQPSPFQTTRKELLLGSQEFIESISLFEALRDDFKHPMNQHQQEDIERAWIRWQKMAGTILSMIKQDEAEQTIWLDKQLETIRTLIAREQDLTEKRQSLESRLSDRIGLSLPAVLDHFDYHISEQKARGKKWLADLQWQRFMNQTEARLKKQQAHEQSEAKIQENLKDLEIERSIHE